MFRYAAQPGDTIISISTKFGVPVNAIIEANPGLYPYNLIVGQIILIPTNYAHPSYPIYRRYPIFPVIPIFPFRLFRRRRFMPGRPRPGFPRAPGMPGRPRKIIFNELMEEILWLTKTIPI